MAETLLMSYPVSSAMTSWYGVSGLFALVILLALVVFAARSALAGRSLLEFRLLEE